MTCNLLSKQQSTTMCTAVPKEIASYYNSRTSDVYGCMLAAYKAFDRVHHGSYCYIYSSSFRILHEYTLTSVGRLLSLPLYSPQHKICKGSYQYYLEWEHEPLWLWCLYVNFLWYFGTSKFSEYTLTDFESRFATALQLTLFRALCSYLVQLLASIRANSVKVPLC